MLNNRLITSWRHVRTLLMATSMENAQGSTSSMTTAMGVTTACQNKMARELSSVHAICLSTNGFRAVPTLSSLACICSAVCLSHLAALYLTSLSMTLLAARPRNCLSLCSFSSAVSAAQQALSHSLLCFLFCEELEVYAQSIAKTKWYRSAIKVS